VGQRRTRKGEADEGKEKAGRAKKGARINEGE
jgi:hypothetical protein